MMKVEIPITLDVTNYSYARPYIDATQGDAGTRYLKVFLTAAGVPVMHTETATAVLNCVKPDKTYTETEGVISDNCIEFELKPQTLACLGSVLCDVQLISADNKRIFTTTPFEIRVHPSVISDDVIESKDEFNLLLSLLENAEKIDEKILQILEEAKSRGEFDGQDGHTPQKGVDYWNELDKSEIKAYVDEAILGGAW